MLLLITATGAPGTAAGVEAGAVSGVETPGAVAGVAAGAVAAAGAVVAGAVVAGAGAAGVVAGFAAGVAAHVAAGGGGAEVAAGAGLGVGSVRRGFAGTEAGAGIAALVLGLGRAEAGSPGIAQIACHRGHGVEKLLGPRFSHHTLQKRHGSHNFRKLVIVRKDLRCRWPKPIANIDFIAQKELFSHSWVCPKTIPYIVLVEKIAIKICRIHGHKKL